MSNEMASIKIPLPSLTEQQTISAYLDEKTLLIDNIISLKHKQIDLLQERRTTLINQVVTKGLDKNVEMVDSGIERIGTIPKDWEVRKLKYETIINIDSLGEKENPNMELLYVDIGNVNIL
jgi:restriction endonuclease S subunit